MTAQRVEFESHLPVSAQRAYDWHARAGAVERMLPPWQPIRRVGGQTRLAEGSEVSFELGRSPFTLRWQARHEAVVDGIGFSDRQIRGPFRFWLHGREFTPLPGGSSSITESIDYEFPGGRLGELVVGGAVRRVLRRTFAYRHRTLRSDLELHSRYDLPPMRIAVSGASGLIGSALVALLSTGGHDVLRLVRRRDPAADAVLWDPQRGVLEPERLEGVDAVIHLAGESLAAGRWTVRRKEEIRRSRSEGTARLVASLAALASPPRHFLCASAIGAYGDSGTDIVDEVSPLGEGFLSEICREWEAAADKARTFAERLTQLRFGVVLSPAGGALAKMLPPFRLGLGGVVGSGDQFLSWISLDDAIAAILHCLATPVDGPVNLVAPTPCTNSELTRALGRVLSRPTLAPLPAAAVKLLFGEMGKSLLLASTRVTPTRLLESGFEFTYDDLEDALGHCLGRRDRMSETDLEVQAAWP